VGNALVYNPIYLSFAFTEKDYLEELKRLKIKVVINWLGENGDACVHSFHNGKGKEYNIVCVNHKKTLKWPIQDVYALLVHEMVHAFQNYKEYVGEDKPSDEFEAYSIQNLCTNAFYAYKKYTEDSLTAAVKADKKKSKESKPVKVK